MGITICEPDRLSVRGGGRPDARPYRTDGKCPERSEQRAGVLVERAYRTPNQGMIALRGESQINRTVYDGWRSPDETSVFGRSDVAHELSEHDITGGSVECIEIAIAASHIDGEGSRNRVGRDRGRGSDAMP